MRRRGGSSGYGDFLGPPSAAAPDKGVSAFSPEAGDRLGSRVGGDAADRELEGMSALVKRGASS